MKSIEEEERGEGKEIRELAGRERERFRCNPAKTVEVQIELLYAGKATGKNILVNTKYMVDVVPIRHCHGSMD